jgi:hypothetical protein
VRTVASKVPTRGTVMVLRLGALFGFVGSAG